MTEDKSRRNFIFFALQYSCAQYRCWLGESETYINLLSEDQV